MNQQATMLIHHSAKVAPTRRGVLQRAAINPLSINAVPPIVHEVLRSPGQPLDARTRQEMETRFGYDFSRVRIHTDACAAESARSVNALAYTIGHDIVFDAGQYAPSTSAGQRLIAHELTHVIQQGSESISTADELRVGLPHDRFEREADRVVNELATTRENSPVIHSRVRSPRLQRTAKFVDGTVSEEFNLAERVANRLFAGNTDFVLNKTIFTAGIDFDVARNALNTPGIASSSRAKSGVDCWFDSVPDNVASYEMKVLKSGAWTINTTKADMANLFPALNACKDGGTDAATFEVKGKPSNNEQRKRTRTHEDHHVVDYKTIVNDILVPWDKHITDANKKHQTIPGTDLDDCEKKLYRAYVGQNQMPDAIVAKIITEINAKAKAFHDSAAGRNVDISNAQSNRDCSTVTAEAR